LGDRVPIGRPRRLRSLARHPIALNVALAFWFSACLAYQRPIFTFNDGYLYWLASAAWLAGGDPWLVATGPHGEFHFSGLPPTVLVFAPLTAIDGRVVAVLLGLASVFAAYVIVRRLQLPIAFLLFPPIVEGIGSANPHLALMALLLAGRGALPAALKVYAVVPLLGERRWGAVAAAGAALLASVVVAPGLWGSYIERIGDILARHRTEAVGGFEATGMLLAHALVALAWLWWQRPRDGGWLTVPAIWPASQFFYWTFALPVLPVPVLALLAIRLPGLAAAVIVAYALVLGMRSGARVQPAEAPSFGAAARQALHTDGGLLTERPQSPLDPASRR
jgi:hypothetical protein